jgi:hypothetical protein
MATIPGSRKSCSFSPPLWVETDPERAVSPVIDHLKESFRQVSRSPRQSQQSYVYTLVCRNDRDPGKVVAVFNEAMTGIEKTATGAEVACSKSSECINDEAGQWKVKLEVSFNREEQELGGDLPYQLDLYEATLAGEPAKLEAFRKEFEAKSLDFWAVEFWRKAKLPPAVQKFYDWTQYE